MFKDVDSEKGLRKLNYVGGRLQNVNTLQPFDSYVKQGSGNLENRFNRESKVNYFYAKRVIIGYEYSKNHYHYKTGNSMLEDINNNKKIYINSYK